MEDKVLSAHYYFFSVKYTNKDTCLFRIKIAYFSRAERLGCINAKWPDLYGHYREAKFTQTKHHWWWKANRIFNELRVTKTYNGKLFLILYSNI